MTLCRWIWVVAAPEAEVADDERSAVLRLAAASLCVLLAILATIVFRRLEAADLSRAEIVLQSIVEFARGPLDPTNDGKVLFAAGRIEIIEGAIDPETGLGASSLILERTVEMFQWTKAAPSTRDATVERAWIKVQPFVSQANSPDGDPRHTNPAAPLESARFKAKVVRLQGVPLQAALIARLSNATSRPVDPEGATLRLASLLRRDDVRLVGHRLIASKDPETPATGDLAIAYQAWDAHEEVSVLARQRGNELVPLDGLAASVLPHGFYRGVRPLSDVLGSVPAGRFSSGHFWNGLLASMVLLIAAGGIYFAPLFNRKVSTGSLLGLGVFVSSLPNLGPGFAGIALVPLALLIGPAYGAVYLLAMAADATWWMKLIAAIAVAGLALWLFRRWQVAG